MRLKYGLLWTLYNILKIICSIRVLWFQFFLMLEIVSLLRKHHSESDKSLHCFLLILYGRNRRFISWEATVQSFLNMDSTRSSREYRNYYFLNLMQFKYYIFSELCRIAKNNTTYRAVYFMTSTIFKYSMMNFISKISGYHVLFN